MARKELSEEIFKKCLNDKIKLLENVVGSVGVRTFSDKGSQDYNAEVFLDFGGPFIRKIKTGGYSSMREANEESVDFALKYITGVVYPNVVCYDGIRKEIILDSAFKANQATQ